MKFLSALAAAALSLALYGCSSNGLERFSDSSPDGWSVYRTSDKNSCETLPDSPAKAEACSSLASSFEKRADLGKGPAWTACRLGLAGGPGAQSAKLCSMAWHFYNQYDPATKERLADAAADLVLWRHRNPVWHFGLDDVLKIPDGTNPAGYRTDALLRIAAQSRNFNTEAVGKMAKDNCEYMGSPAACALASHLAADLDRAKAAKARAEYAASKERHERDDQELREELGAMRARSDAQVREILQSAGRTFTPPAPVPAMSPAQTATAPSSAAMCSAVGRSCEAESRACQSGGQAACYRAAACICRATMAAGGCGSDPAPLRRCVAENEENARKVQSNAPVFSTAPTSRVQPPPQTDTPRVQPQDRYRDKCPPGATACAAY